MINKIQKIALSISVTGILIFLCNSLHSEEYLAIVEDTSPNLTVVGLFDYLTAGSVIELESNEWVSLGYLNSCNQELITGGKIVIGTDKSTVSGGSVSREKVQCDSDNLQLTTDQTNRSGVAVMRKGNDQLEVEMVIYSTSPVFYVTTNSEQISISRIDRPEKLIIINVENNNVDLYQHNVSLDRGGLYGVTTNKTEVVFRVDRFSQPGTTPFLSRLIIL